MTVPGLRTFRSRHDPAETLERLEAAVAQHGMTVFARIDHGAAAEKVGMELRPTVVVLFGNPKAGTPYMQASQTLGIDLPLKALVWQDGEGTTWVGVNEPAWLFRRHGVDDEGSADVMNDVLANVAGQATA
ncbi:MAG: DUF302 domain-containing protein [Pseudomonadota bacterium]